MGRTAYQRKYYALKRRCEQVQQTNERLVNRIHYVKKIVKRYKAERKFLMERLDRHGDRYRDALVPAMWEEHFLNETPFVPPMPSRLDQPVVSSVPHPLLAGQINKSTSKKKKTKTGLKVGTSKKPVNAFLLFCQYRRNALQSENITETGVELSQQELTKRLSQEWRNLDQEGKKVFYDKYEAEKHRMEELRKLGIPTPASVPTPGINLIPGS
ncbi:hypothetical protein CAPTEDRAFT_221946 [Capitella teleta]|uniref:HMG box domain-containing protein n=1 Tax=Capitella teleta TaxID=283909 RepID=R7VGT2_CAPTE|nr:hypothetical protein CAPTEDRAFT_221946 [Capitella teleta]|eukprot:ELU17814.1 hypothetical protein CAPTEDRAFT_221946 [Capitella teleta]